MCSGFGFHSLHRGVRKEAQASEYEDLDTSAAYRGIKEIEHSSSIAHTRGNEIISRLRFKLYVHISIIFK